jgi:gliding motility-associated-like protein
MRPGTEHRLVLGAWMLFCLCMISPLFGQNRVSHNNYTGDWESPSSWDPQWDNPVTSFSGFTVTVNGYITVNGSLDLYGTPTEIIVNDTLVVKGDLRLGNNSNLIINDYAIVIIRGDMYLSNQAKIAENGYLIVTGNLLLEGSISQGLFTSNDDPVKLFIAGSVPEGTDGHSNYPVLCCSDTITEPYANSGCSYGNMDDLMNDPVFEFFQSTCLLVALTTNSPVCIGNTIEISETAGISWQWSGPGGFTSREQHLFLEQADSGMTGTYTAIVTDVTGCTVTASVEVVVNRLPVVNITSSENPLCAGDKRELTAIPAGGTFTIKSGQGYISGNMLTATGPGYIELEYLFSDGCENRVLQSILAEDFPHPEQGPDQELEFIFNTKMQASLMPFETGKWSLISGSGRIGNPHSPQTDISNLSLGENVFLWTVQNRACTAGAEVKIIVNDLFVPSVITPNEDGRNDYFMISRVESPVELIVFNRWGLEEYRNTNYRNLWDGRNNNGIRLPEDTYFYILRFEDGVVRKGTILIKR